MPDSPAGPSEIETLRRILESELKLREATLDVYQSLGLFTGRDIQFAVSDIAGLPGNTQVQPPWYQPNTKRGEVIPVYRTEQELRLIQDRMRVLANYNEFAICALENRCNYVVGDGLKYSASPKDVHNAVHRKSAEAVQCVIDRWSEINDLPAVEAESLWRLDTEGEAIIRGFRDKDGYIHERFVEPEHVKPPSANTADPINSFGVVTKKNDVGTVEGYWIVDDPLTDPNPTYVKADKVAHLKLNVRSTAKRGLPTFFPVEANLKRCEDLLASMTSMAKARAKIALIRKITGLTSSTADRLLQNLSKVHVNDPATGETLNIERLRYGTVLTASANTDYEMPGLQLGASDIVEVLQAELRAIASRLSMPEWMFTALADAKYSNAFIVEAPTLKSFRRLQRQLRNGFGLNRHGHRKSLLWRQLESAVEAGYLTKGDLDNVTVSCEGPTLEARDRMQEVERHEKLVEVGFESKETAQRALELDPDVEKPLIKVEQIGKARPVTDSSAVAQIQQAFYAGKMPRDAAAANLMVLLAFTREQAEQLLPASDCVKRTDDGRQPGAPGVPGTPGMPGGDATPQPGGGPGNQGDAQPGTGEPQGEPQKPDPAEQLLTKALTAKEQAGGFTGSLYLFFNPGARHKIKLLEAGFTGAVTAKNGVTYHYVDGKRVSSGEHEAHVSAGGKPSPVIKDPDAGQFASIIHLVGSHYAAGDADWKTAAKAIDKVLKKYGGGQAEWDKLAKFFDLDTGGKKSQSAMLQAIKDKFETDGADPELVKQAGGKGGEEPGTGPEPAKTEPETPKTEPETPPAPETPQQSSEEPKPKTMAEVADEVQMKIGHGEIKDPVDFTNYVMQLQAGGTVLTPNQIAQGLGFGSYAAMKATYWPEKPVEPAPAAPDDAAAMAQAFGHDEPPVDQEEPAQPEPPLEPAAPPETAAAPAPAPTPTFDPKVNPAKQILVAAVQADGVLTIHAFPTMKAAQTFGQKMAQNHGPDNVKVKVYDKGHFTDANDLKQAIATAKNPFTGEPLKSAAVVHGSDKDSVNAALSHKGGAAPQAEQPNPYAGAPVNSTPQNPEPPAKVAKIIADGLAGAEFHDAQFEAIKAELQKMPSGAFGELAAFHGTNDDQGAPGAASQLALKLVMAAAGHGNAPAAPAATPAPAAAPEPAAAPDVAATPAAAQPAAPAAGPAVQLGSESGYKPSAPSMPTAQPHLAAAQKPSDVSPGWAAMDALPPDKQKLGALVVKQDPATGGVKVLAHLPSTTGGAGKPGEATLAAVRNATGKPAELVGAVPDALASGGQSQWGIFIAKAAADAQGNFLSIEDAKKLMLEQAGGSPAAVARIEAQFAELVKHVGDGKVAQDAKIQAAADDLKNSIHGLAELNASPAEVTASFKHKLSGFHPDAVKQIAAKLGTTPDKLLTHANTQVQENKGLPNLSSLKNLKPIGKGSTGAKVGTTAGGAKVVVKDGGNTPYGQEQVPNEVAADKIYSILGANVPKSKVQEQGGKLHKVAQWVDGKDLGEYLKTATKAQADAVKKEIQKHFVASALLGNWDVAGEDLDNIKVGADGKPFFIDNGGSFDVAATATKKGGVEKPYAADHVPELETLLQPQYKASEVFKGITKDEIKKQIADVVAKKAEIVAATPAAHKAAIGKRIDYLKTWAAKDGKPNAVAIKGNDGKEIRLNPKPGVYIHTPNVSKGHGDAHGVEYINHIDAKTYQGVHAYTSSSYKALNKALYGKQGAGSDASHLSGHNKEVDTAMQAAFAAQPKFPARKLTRMMDDPGPGFWAMLERAKGADAPIKWRNYQSAGPGGTFGSGKSVKITFENVTEGGIDVEPITAVSSEHEMVLNRGTFYRVKAIKDLANGKKHVVMEQVPKEHAEKGAYLEAAGVTPAGISEATPGDPPPPKSPDLNLTPAEREARQREKDAEFAAQFVANIAAAAGQK